MPVARLVHCACAVLSFAAVAYGSPCATATLRNGFAIRYTRHEAIGPNTRLWVCTDDGTGYMDVPAGTIEDFGTAPPPAVPEPAPVRAVVPPAKDTVGGLISRTAFRYNLDPDFVASVVHAESGANPAAVSPKGARGLMQLMPATAALLGVEDVLDPAANLEGGTRYLRGLLDQYGGDAVKALAAYNAGPLRVRQFGGVPPYRETRAYVARIIEDYNRKKLEQQPRK